ncbi:MAG: DALR anticodon-binding domain-containing protein [Vulcanimicrobiaceae bacterium]
MNPTITSSSPIDAALQSFAAALTRSVATLYNDAAMPTITFESPRRPEFGDFATNVGFALAKSVRKAPQHVGNELIAHLREHEATALKAFAAIDAAAGFINLRLAPDVWHTVLSNILGNGDAYGQLPPRGERISLEFGSANPTGPLVVVQGRALSVGDTLARAMRLCGYDVFVEWIINDAGRQVEMLGRSLYARYRQCFDAREPFPEDGYPGSYLLPIAEKIVANDGRVWMDREESQWLPHFTRIGRDELVAQQKHSVANFGVTYDLWQSEKELHDDGRVTISAQPISKKAQRSFARQNSVTIKIASWFAAMAVQRILHRMSPIITRNSSAPSTSSIFSGRITTGI